MSNRDINPMASTYAAFMEILQNLTIKYSYKAEEYETLQTRQSGDEYIDAYLKRDTFDTYIDYTSEELIAVGITDSEIIDEATAGNTVVIPVRYRDDVLKLRRQRVIDDYEEQNNYYRMLNGYPDLEDTKRFYVSDETRAIYGMEDNVPVHMIQDYYNKKEEGRGDYYVSVLEGSGYINRLIEANPDKTYLKYFGTSRILISNARLAKNFQVLQLKVGNLNNTLYNQFLQLYEQCRTYFIDVIYIKSLRSIFDGYDNFMALCIMVMTIQQLVLKQMTLAVNREFFDIYAVKMLYEVYGVPYNLNLDDITQSKIAQNLNMFIQDKATNGVLYNIAYVLGFGSNFSVYKYYLSKEHKVDAYGVPLFGYTERFNDDTGEVDVVPDYEYMYDLYFHRAELLNHDFINTFDTVINIEPYDEVVEGDPYWWLDTETYKKVWETEYNFVESKYLGLSISYKITDIMFENILLLKLLISKQPEIKELSVTLPKITGNIEVPVFDVVILLVCLTAAKHNLTGEIITIPTQVLSVLDFLHNKEGDDTYLVDTFGFDFSWFDDPKNQKDIDFMCKKLLSPEDVERFKNYISVLSIKNHASKEEKIKTLNEMYQNIKGLYRFINYHMTKTNDKRLYLILRNMYHTLYYTREVKDIFQIGMGSGEKRTAYNFFEFLYITNPLLYSKVFDTNFDNQYQDYLTKNNLREKDYSFEQWKKDGEEGKVTIKYDLLKDVVVDNEVTKDEKIYYYVNHAISRLELVVHNLNYIYLLSDSITPIETLLIKLCRFFKSYTTEIINLDNLYIADLKPENIMRLWDIPHYLEKTIVPKENFRLAYSDIVRLTDNYVLYDNLYLWDRLIYEVWLHLKDHLYFKEKLHYMDKSIYPKENILLFDNLYYTTETLAKDRFKIKERVITFWSNKDEDDYDI